MITAAVGTNASLYGLPLPNAGYVLILQGANPAIYSSTTGPFAAHFFFGWVGIWLDAYWGLAATAPVFLLGAAGLPALYRYNRGLTLRLLALTVPYYIAVASTSFWTGGPTPTPRYLVPVLPFLALPLALVFDRWRTAVGRVTAGALIAAGGLIAMASLTAFDADYSGLRLAGRCLDSFGISMASLLPLIKSEPLSARSILTTFAWTAAVLALALIVRKREPKLSEEKAAVAGESSGRFGR
jgi:hypothetical protein